ncbi:MAG: hypothetical protein B7X53_00010 [Hyphomonas sp. 34-62-18]|nr:MAG: hypothetical protein B7X53_00010 [Hyphomonas sp. 34-62-18]
MLRADHIPTLQALASALLRAGEAEAALNTFDRALTLAPGQADTLHGRGLALLKLQDRSGALIAFRAAAASDPNAWKSWGSIADITPHEGERLDAIHRTADTLEAHCRERDAAPALYTECVTALLDAHRPEDAVAFTCEMQPRFCDEATAYDALGRAHYYMGAYRAAFEHKARALALSPAPTAQAPLAFSPGAATDALREIGRILTSHAISFFLAAGTLLGFYREGGPLPHDRDVDIGVMRTSDGGPDIAGIFRTHPDLILKRRARPGDRYFALMHKGIGIDIFVHDKIDDHLVCGVSDLNGDIQWRFTPFEIAEARFNGEVWAIPDTTERYLAESYGPDWRRPDTGFASAISSPALYMVDSYVRAFYSSARAKNALASGDRMKAEALIRQSPIPLFLNAPKGALTSSSKRDNGADSNALSLPDG